ncbi:hypothetical protein NGF19_23230 [Streptomyces sp. RY43-2]|uniref:Uncharacterized protein n=1 Tax=Streptomyces macrolidinus TaxID=2952607 RepID=A0ABT0ZJ94_9ACTN|nr:hypothetical protein [Streptomyces macrolidinus]MCN9243664.1 hypothetical protein [Streptomyces macrolidinus]
MTTAQNVFFVLVTLAIALGVSLASVGYFRKVTLPRPAVGVFNGKDMVIMMGFVIALPFLYLALPDWLLPPVLGLTLAGGLSVGYGAVVRRGSMRWAIILCLLAADWITARGAEDDPTHALPYWLINSAVIMLMVVGAANLNTQGGLKLRHVSRFALALAVYDLFFATVVPLTQKLFGAVQGYAFAPSAGVRIGELGGVVGMGDLLVYALFSTVAYKAYGRRGLTVALCLVAVFGALAPTLAPITVEAFTGHLPEIVPAQIFFGPAAFIGYLALRRIGPERRMIEVRPPARVTSSEADEERERAGGDGEQERAGAGIRS